MGWRKDRPHTSGKSVSGVACFPESDTSLLANKTSQHLGRTEGICSCGLLGFISQQAFSGCPGGVFATYLSENAICIPRATHHSSRHERSSPLSLCLFSACASSPWSTGPTTRLCPVPAPHWHIGDLNAA